MSELSTSTDAGLPGHSLRVKGASVFYRVRGHGPHLLILPGGDGDADTTEDLCRHLVDRYSVITYDRRGMSRSTVDDPTDTLTLDTHSDDVHRLLATLTSQPVLVFGSSIGALIGLDLVARHSEQVSCLSHTSRQRSTSSRPLNEIARCSYRKKPKPRSRVKGSKRDSGDL
jgi:pimeloyl-ACP methyl ester carboxylesterase